MVGVGACTMIVAAGGADGAGAGVDDLEEPASTRVAAPDGAPPAPLSELPPVMAPGPSWRIAPANGMEEKWKKASDMRTNAGPPEWKGGCGPMA